ncbi:MAG TPA: methyltransferase domain-containing protein [Candidatus Binataceae bacterium]|nr:methyltransferase domain-containing protein [Candidatus Binataceae bacterium]HVB78944.1 methyltransferase domain-containing protein [Candidatus Binataceae bacterium]
MARHCKAGIAVLAVALLFGIGSTNAVAQLQQLPADKYIARMNKPGRDLKVHEVIAKLKLKPGDVVADIGSGSGAFSIPMAKAIAPNGTLYAVDIDQKMLDYVAKRAKEAGVTNLHTVLGGYDDPKLPVKNVDVAFFHRVLHMIEHREAYLDAVAKYLKPDGRVVVIDKNPEDSPDNWMWLKQSDVDSWMAAIGFYPVQHFGIYDDRYFVVYQRPYGNSPLVTKHEAGLAGQ